MKKTTSKATPETTPAPTRKIFPKPAVADGFPLSWHKGRGYWFKKRQGVQHIYEADAARSLARWEADEKALADGDAPAGPRKRYTLRDAVNLYLTRQKRRMDAGDLSAGQFAKARGELEYHLPRAIPLNTPLDAFRARGPSDDGPAAVLHRIRARAIKRGLSVAHRHIVFVRAVLNFAADRKLMLPPDYGDSFDPPSKGRMDRVRHETDAAKGERAWTVEQLRAILDGARALREERRAKVNKNRVPRNHHLYAQVLLGLFAAYGSDDVSALPELAVNFTTGFVKTLRAKEDGRPCAAILPAVVLDAIRWSIDHRPADRSPGAAHLLFCTADGNPCNVAPLHNDENGVVRRVGRNDTIGQNFKRLLQKLGLHKYRMGFKSLRAACRTLLVGGNVHEDVIAVMMGRKFRYPVDDYYIRGDLRAEMVKAAKHLETTLFPKLKVKATVKRTR